MDKKATADLAALIDSSEDLIWSVDQACRLVAFNGAFQRYLLQNRGLQVCVGMEVTANLPPERAALWRGYYWRALSEGPFRLEHPAVDGRTLELAFNTLVVDGKAAGVSVFSTDVTERNRVKEALRRGNAQFRRFFQENASPMALVEPVNGEIVAANRAAADFVGTSSQQLVGMFGHQFNMGPPEELAINRQKAMRGELRFINSRFRLASGELRHVEVYASPISVDRKSLLYVILHDVTDRKRAEDAARQSGEVLRDAQIVGSLGSYVLDIPQGVWTSSEVLDGLLGIGEDYERTVAGWHALVHPEDRAMMLAYYEDEVLAKGIPFDKEYRIIRQTDQAVRWVNGMGRLEFDTNGLPIKLRGIIKDTTERKEAEMKLRESEELYRATFDQAPVGIVHTAREGRMLRCNARFAQIVGYSPEEIPGMTFEQITMPGDIARSLDLLQELQSAAPSRPSIEKRYVRKDGEITWVRLTVSAQNDADGQLLHYISLVEDINERRANEERLESAVEELQRSEMRYRTIFQSSLDGVCVNRFEDGRFMDANRAFLDLVGLEHSDLIGKTLEDLNLEIEPEALAQVVQQLARNATARDIKSRFKRPTGETVWLRMSVSPIEVDGVPCTMSIIGDISAAKAAEERLAEAAEALRVSEERYRKIFQTSVDPVVITRLADGAIIDANRAFVELFGIEPGEMIGRTTGELNIWVDPEDRQKMLASLRQTGECRNLEALARKKSGETAWTQISASPIEVGSVPCILIVARDVSESRAAQQRLAAAADALKSSEERYRKVFQTSIDAMSITRLSDGVYLDVNPAAIRLFGFSREEFLGQNAVALGMFADPRDRQFTLDCLRTQGECPNVECRLVKKNGESIWALFSSSVIEIQGVPCVLSVGRDITEAKTAQQRLSAAADALKVSEERYRKVFDTSFDAILIVRIADLAYIDVNPVYLDALGFDRWEVIGKSLLELDIWADARDREALLDQVRRTGECRNLEVQLLKKGGGAIWALVSASAIEIDGAPCLMAVARDISSAKLAQQEIRNLAFYDPLTGLPNRRLLLERLQLPMATSARLARMRALLWVDLDNFKTLNYTLGHQVGDQLLIEVARRILACVRKADTVARLGGDEFVIMLEGLSGRQEDAAIEARAVGEKILAAIDHPYRLAGRVCRSTASIGIRVFGVQQESTSEVLKQADIAMFKAKEAGRNTMRFFSPALQAALDARALLEEEIGEGIKAQQFVFYYQPQVEDGRLIGAEALMRWNHPRRGLLLPGEFIPLAEETGLILPLGAWGLEVACWQLAEWARRKETADLSLSVNISGLRFRQDGFVEEVLSTISRTGAHPARLILEITESVLLDNVEETIERMNALRTHGIRFGLDDFGTGYSSLSYLKRLPLDQLKIDRSFVRDLMVDVTSGAIAQAIVTLGKAMGLSVLAEGVETEEQREYLSGLGCHSFQGFLFSRPVPIQELERRWLGSSENAPAFA